METHIISSELTHKIRQEVLWPHITNGDYSISVDDHFETFHLGTFLEKKIISIGTFMKEKNSDFNTNSQYRLRAMATDINYRNMGAGKRLFLHAIDILNKQKIEVLWCHARLIAIPFYESVNMKSLPKIYNIQHIGPHKTMYIHLNLIK